MASLTQFSEIFDRPQKIVVDEKEDEAEDDKTQQQQQMENL